MRKCLLCGTSRDKRKRRSTIERHHISYQPVVLMDLCQSCHSIISNYERNHDVYNTDEPCLKIVKEYNIFRERLLNAGDVTIVPSLVISVRLPENVLYTLQERAIKQGFQSIGEYVKHQIIKSCIVNKLTEDTIPIYNPYKHHAGDRVLVRRGKKLIETIVPEIDGDGHPIPVS